MGIGKRIKQARENLGLTQKELGEKIGVTGSAITNYENGISHPKEPILYRLFEVLKVDANYLFQDEMHPSPANPEGKTEDVEKERLSRNYDKLSQDGKTALVKYSDFLSNDAQYSENNPQP